MLRRKRGVAASVSVDDLRAAYYSDVLTADSQWWWVREVRLNPAELIVDTDEGELMRVPYKVNGDDTVTFYPPVEVEVAYVDVPAGADTDDEEQTGPVTVAASAPDQVVARRYDDRVAAGARDKGTAERPEARGSQLNGSVRAQIDRTPVAATTPPALPASPTDVAPSALSIVPNDAHEERSVTPEQLALLGLGPDATEAEVTAALMARLATGTATPTVQPGEVPGPAGAPAGVPAAPAAVPSPADPGRPSTDGNPLSQPNLPSGDPSARPATAPVPQGPPAQGVVTALPTLPEGMTLVDSEMWRQVTESVAASNAERVERAGTERLRIVETAVRAGKIPASRRDHYAAMLSADPAGTQAFIAAMPQGLIPVTERGYQGGETEVEAATSYPAAWGSTVAASRRATKGRIQIEPRGDV